MAVIHLIVESVMNTVAQSGSNKLILHTIMITAAHCGSNTAYIAQCYDHSSTLWQ